MSKTQKFRAVIEDAGGGGAFVTVPFDVEQVFGKKRVKVKATIEGEQYRGSLVRMGSPQHMLVILKSIREKIGKTFGDEVEVEVEEDTGQREVSLPQDIRQALENDPEAAAIFQRLAYSHQKEYVQWIDGAKREQTRQGRIAKMLETLKQKK